MAAVDTIYLARLMTAARSPADAFHVVCVRVRYSALPAPVLKFDFSLLALRMFRCSDERLSITVWAGRYRAIARGA